MKYLDLAETYKELEENPSRLKKIEILSSLLNKLKKEKNKEIIYLLQGRIFPDFNKTELGVSSQLIKKAITRATGTSEEKITKLWKEKGDLGLVAAELVSRKSQTTLTLKELTAEKVLENLRKLCEFSGKGTVDKKLALISELLTAAKPIEAKYITRTVLTDLRIGIGDSSLRDAIVGSCLKDKDKKLASDLVQEAYDKTTDFFIVFEDACKGAKFLENTELTPGRPVKVMLFPKVKDIKEGFERAGKPAAFEFKYDGFRMMINKYEGKLKIFTRRLDEVTPQFPDAAKYANEFINAKSFIIDCEAVGYDPKTKQYKPFQAISQRIKRKYDIEKLEKELPIELNIFDIIYYNGKSLLNEPFIKRRKIIEKIVKEKKFKIRLAEQLITDSEEKAQKFYEIALKQGQEGLMIKKLDSPYKPGVRIGHGFKLKPQDKDFDLVITGAEYGTGKRAGWLTSYDVSCRDKDKLLEIGKVSTGLKEKEELGLSFKEMTEKLKPLIKKESGKKVILSPEIIVAVTYQNIQKSPSYSSGFALRFPRITALRPDRNKDDITSLSEIKNEYEKAREWAI